MFTNYAFTPRHLFSHSAVSDSDVSRNEHLMLSNFTETRTSTKIVIL